METLIISIGVLAIIGMIAFLIHLFMIAYNEDQKEQDERMLVLEKRLEEYKGEDKEEIKKINTALKNLDEGMNKNYLDIQKQLRKKSDKNEL